MVFLWEEKSDKYELWQWRPPAEHERNNRKFHIAYHLRMDVITLIVKS